MEKQIEIHLTLGGTCKLESTLFDVELPLSVHLTEYEQILELLKAFCYGLNISRKVKTRMELNDEH
ncbi:MAG: hypothetical protein KME46_33985 [Brasilonema angustatum HA4187-MV1]|jgi:hypothetical protein|nr:hypothetical protein [Brasilonema angustatum HA4187-MV1]